MQLSTVAYSIVFFSYIVLIAGCGKQTQHRTNSATEAIVIDSNAMPENTPHNLQQKLIWGLLKLDHNVIAAALTKGADAYRLKANVTGLRPLAADEQLSPYALLLEGYLNCTYLEEDQQIIFTALDTLYRCIELMIKNNISVDYGVITLGSHPTLHRFIEQSLSRLNKEKNSEGVLDEESNYSFDILQKIQKCIEEYQPFHRRIIEKE